MKRIAYIAGLICLLVACSERREYTVALSRAVAVASDHPDSALAILDSLGRHEPHFGNHFRMQYRLHRLKMMLPIFRTSA